MAKQNKPRQGSLRIIGGQWRGRQLLFPDLQGLRPTPDRVRETVFNWLQTLLPGSRCLDCCSGSGALGFEAASRGAAHVDMVELDRQAFGQLQQNAKILAAQQCAVSNQTVQQFIKTVSQPYDIVFLDPPYQAGLWTPIADLLTAHKLLSNDARIYVECGRKQALPELPENWQLLKDKTAGDVRYRLYRYFAGSDSE